MKMTEIITNLGKLIDYGFSKIWITIPIFTLIGLHFYNYYSLEMNQDVWFWFFSTISQTFAALIALVAIFLFSRLELYNSKINNNIQFIRNSGILTKTIANELDDEILIVDTNNYICEVGNSEVFTDNVLNLMKLRQNISKLEEKKKQAINHMRTSLIYTILIIMISILLLPLGTSISIDNFDFWAMSNVLKWAFIYGFSGLCFSSLYKISIALGDFLNE